MTILGHLPVLPCRSIAHLFKPVLLVLPTCAACAAASLATGLWGMHLMASLAQSSSTAQPSTCTTAPRTAGKRRGRIDNSMVQSWMHVDCVELVNANNIVQPKDNSQESWTSVATRLVLTGFNREATAAQTQFDRIPSSGLQSSIGNSPE